MTRLFALLLLLPLGCKIQPTPEEGKPKVEVVYRSPVSCTANHGVWRWDVKTDQEEPPTVIANDHQVDICTMSASPNVGYEWGVPDEKFDAKTPRVGREKEFFQVCGQVTLVKAESDGDLHVQLRDVSGRYADCAEVVVEVPVGKRWNQMREEVFRWTTASFPFS